MVKHLSFDEIAKPLLDNKKFYKISEESHHGITRMEHSMRVARNVYRISKRLNLDYISATRAAILHDFFTNDEFGTNRGLIQGVIHPDIAVANAKGEFALNKIEENAIASHMFPLNMTLPRYKESWILTGVDKMIAIYEYFSYKFHYTKFINKVNTQFNYLGIMLFYILTMGKR